MRVKGNKKSDIQNLDFHNFLIDTLKEIYPVQRIKDEKKFKRAIVVTRQTIFLSETNNQALFNKLTTELYNIIGADPQILADAVFEYLY